MGNPRIALKVRILPDLAVAGSHRQGPVRGMGDGTAGVDPLQPLVAINFACFRDRLVAIPLEMQMRRSQNIEIRHRHHYRKATVRVHQYPDGQLAIFDGPSCLARFDPIGKPIDVSRAA
jgi:hypothetical protein